MSTDSFLGLPWWQWLLIVLVCGTIAVLARKAAARAKKREHAEKLAQMADAAHEGAATRHEGGP